MMLGSDVAERMWGNIFQPADKKQTTAATIYTRLTCVLRKDSLRIVISHVL